MKPIKWHHRCLKILFFALLVKPFLYLTIGLNVRKIAPLQRKGPLILIGNHNSHLDTIVMMSLYPLQTLHRVRPIAAADYFLRTPLLRWFSCNILGIIPLSRNSTTHYKSFLQHCRNALLQDDILIIFPEGSRGIPETLAPFQKGITHLTHLTEQCTVQLIVMSNLGKVLPKGEALLVPFNCTVIIDAPITITARQPDLVATIEARAKHLLQLHPDLI